MVLPSQAVAADFFAESCAGYDCSHEGQVCPQGAKGASDRSYICLQSKWVPTTCTERNIMDLYNKLNDFMSNTKSKNYNIGKKFSKFVYNEYDISIEKMNIELRIVPILSFTVADKVGIAIGIQIGGRTAADLALDGG